MLATIVKEASIRVYEKSKCYSKVRVSEMFEKSLETIERMIKIGEYYATR